MYFITRLLHRLKSRVLAWYIAKLVDREYNHNICAKKSTFTKRPQITREDVL